MSLNIREDSQEILFVGKKKYHVFSLSFISKYFGNIEKLPKSLKIILENVLRRKDNTAKLEDIQALIDWQNNGHIEYEIDYYPVRILMQDFTGVPAIIDLATMREIVQKLGGNANTINPSIPVDLIIDHSITVDYFGTKDALKKNTQLEMDRNYERYKFLRWGQKTFNNFRVVPPGTGICHQVNLEYLGKIIWDDITSEKHFAWPDTVIGTDSHTTMINALGILGWGMGGIEAEAAMLGQPISMLIPDVVGFKLTGKLCSGVNATDLVLTITQILRKHGVVNKFVEFYGDGLENLSLADRGTIANMAPEYGATCGFFPVDQITLDYMKLTGRDTKHILLVEKYTKKQGMWRYSGDEPIFTNTLTLDMSEIRSSIAGPKRPQDCILIKHINSSANQAKDKSVNYINYLDNDTGLNYVLQDGAVVISAITSCTNTSNPNVLIAAALLAKKAIKLGLKQKPWVKTSLAPGSKVVSVYLNQLNLLTYFEQLGFNIVGYGCMTCIGNSGPLNKDIELAIIKNNLTVNAVLSGNRNFEGRIHPLVKENWLASPPLVIAYAIAGTMKINLKIDAIGKDYHGNNIFLKDIWPSNEEIASVVQKIKSKLFYQAYKKIFLGSQEWKNIKVNNSVTYEWNSLSTYIQPSPFFENMKIKPNQIDDIINAKILAIFGDSITTDHISPAGKIDPNSPAGFYLTSNAVEIKNFNSYGSRRGNHEVMVRGTFSNIRIKNEILPDKEGGYTKYFPKRELMTIYDAAMKYKQYDIPLVLIAGKEYGSGSSRDWAAKGPYLQGIRVVIAESFERIHRSNLIGMGILPLIFTENLNRKKLRITGAELIDIKNLSQLKPKCTVKVIIKRNNEKKEIFNAYCCIYTNNELNYYNHGGILKYTIRNMIS
ncbi:aconitate hydratase AcnA [Candidatus Pantoea edessiphila]|uniref:Aconitate hydratase n=1 Tax=Candidatus Pantoea edessiphila TaxID=2044610 RepID=A0A2P5SYP7_9GAMM|nr:aconitate hydratase AcnA [Candidatus Pantoea edessiphila]MBK4775409.1 aconitate hydratase AcnA [Pantoea sp. Edef]PPI87461.1 aconitate hydratase AcnA [Candidatus Pantoea edessiphila]